ncbi:PQQ-binding-like beta-propeller repeat protein [Microbulbifer sp. CAU 1566]|uniref:outer membrane protein assembly factor BamB family protein n=1 Tax=Microbulbifer sp. CAU 1566 TaxID=2933269 RepID=UPI002003254F|nr:PQQ-binding-like beta-propeller repeat protein [Microbulbifer sp. CAU 1566]MCK7598029.1 PQQ-binding-like beta-propeller repeat protein [Microbulbifer sp. CAU 1566]
MFLAALSLGFHSSAFSGEFEVSGSHNFVRSPGKPETQTVQFSAPKIGQHYVLRIYNGENAEELVTSARVALNGTDYFEPADFKKSALFLDTPLISLELQNSLYVMLDGKPGSGLAAEVIGIDNVAPTISASINPDPNSAGWHNTDVNVSFLCEDELSGIASCTSPIDVSAEGATQGFVGEAKDKAGNTATVTATISLDKTVPVLNSEILPQANSNGWHNQPVAITYTCSDSLSGISACPDTATVNQEGGSQSVSAEALDLANNKQEIEDLVNLDLTPPTISASVSPAANSAGWHSSPVTVSFNCTDSLSGIETCESAETYSGDGANQLVSGIATDLAGNTKSTSVTFNLDTTSPEINFISPVNGALLRDRLPTVQLLLSDNIAIDPESFSLNVTGSIPSSCSLVNGRATCQFLQPLPVDSKIVLIARVNDNAGNTTEISTATAIDTDFDAVADYLDQCPETPTTESADVNGCALTQLDSDQDGISDAEEIAAGSDPQDATSFPPVLIETFTATPSAIDSQSQPVKLSWKVSGADKVVLSNDTDEDTYESQELQGELNTNPKITTIYILTASGPAGEVRASATVKINVPQPSELWTDPSVPVQEKIATSLAVSDDGSAYVGAFDGNFYKVNSRGEIEWTFENSGLVMGKAAISGNRIIFGANFSEGGKPASAGRVFALNSSKQPLWSFDTDGAVVAGPLLSSDSFIVYIATYSGSVYALNAQDGSSLWQLQLPDGAAITSSPALSGHRLIVHTEDKKIFALDSRVEIESDRILWSRNLY